MYDVIDLMKLGHKNRAVGATALNDRSSRSHRFAILTNIRTKLQCAFYFFYSIYYIILIRLI